MIHAKPYTDSTHGSSTSMNGSWGPFPPTPSQHVVCLYTSGRAPVLTEAVSGSAEWPSLRYHQYLACMLEARYLTGRGHRCWRREARSK